MQVFISVIQLFYIKSQKYKIANTKFQNFWQKHKFENSNPSIQSQIMEDSLYSILFLLHSFLIFIYPLLVALRHKVILLSFHQ